MASPVWNATERLCIKNTKEGASPVTLLIQRPSSFKTGMESGPTAPVVSKATGWNKYPQSRCEYFFTFSSSAYAAAAPASPAHRCLYDWQKVSTHYYYYCDSTWKKARWGKENQAIKQEKEAWTMKQGTENKTTRQDYYHYSCYGWIEFVLLILIIIVHVQRRRRWRNTDTLIGVLIPFPF